MPKLIVIAGPANSGKMPLARKLLKEDPDLLLVHRDHLREDLTNKVDEWFITLLMADLAKGILRLKRSPLICAWNMDTADHDLWTKVSYEFSVNLEWLDTRVPLVQDMIPPMQQEQTA